MVVQSVLAFRLKDIKGKDMKVSKLNKYLDFIRKKGEIAGLNR